MKLKNLGAKNVSPEEKGYRDTLEYHPVELPCPKCGQETLEADNLGGFYLRCIDKKCSWKGW
jgi:hypothetical protein